MNQRKKKERITDAEAKEAYKEASKFVLDIAKLVFAGIILGAIMDMGISKENLLAVGSLVAAILTVAGALLYYLGIKKYCSYGFSEFPLRFRINRTMHHSLVPVSTTQD